MIGLAVITDGRWEYLAECLGSLCEMVPGGAFDYSVLVDDSADVMSRCPWGLGWDQAIVHQRRHGLAASVRDAWTAALEAGCDFLFHVEEDFVFHRPVDLGLMAEVLGTVPNLAQIVLKRQAWSPEERAAGGIVELAPDEYVDATWWGDRQVTLAEHRRVFSLNPCLIPRRVLEFGWPDGNEAEFTRMCVDKGLYFAFWGGRFAYPVVEHIGVRRSAGWSL